MNPELRKQILVNAAWLVGLGVVSGGVVHGTTIYLDARKAGIESTRRDLSDLTEQVEGRAAEASRDSGLATAALNEARALANDESLRIEQLAESARAAGVTVVALRGRAPALRADGRVVACAHELGVSGDYRRVAQFLGDLQRAPGTVSLDELEIEPDEAEGRVKAALVVAWFACGDEAVAPTSAIAPEDLPPTPRAASPAELAAQRARAASLAWGRDPFAAPARNEVPRAEPEVAAPASPAPTPSALAVSLPVLTGIAFGGDVGWAIVDREIVRAGDRLASGHQVVRVERRVVTLRLDGETVTLKLGEPE